MHLTNYSVTRQWWHGLLGPKHVDSVCSRDKTSTFFVGQVNKKSKTFKDEDPFNARGLRLGARQVRLGIVHCINTAVAPKHIVRWPKTI